MKDKIESKDDYNTLNKEEKNKGASSTHVDTVNNLKKDNNPTQSPSKYNKSGKNRKNKRIDKKNKGKKKKPKVKKNKEIKIKQIQTLIFQSQRDKKKHSIPVYHEKDIYSGNIFLLRKMNSPDDEDFDCQSNEELIRNSVNRCQVQLNRALSSVLNLVLTDK